MYSIGSKFNKGAIIDLRELDTRYCTHLDYAFYDYSAIYNDNLSILGIESFDTSNVKSFNQTFNCAHYIVTRSPWLNLDLSKWDVRNGTSFFWIC